MSFLEELAAKRQQLLDGIDANEGDINLRIFEDFYPDEAHFIYELLQNAEDAGATEVAFDLTPNACHFEHNGTRHFDERDIKSITGIFNSSKKDNPDKIGKFGVGFKSVFVYTDTPVIHSKNYSFKILKLVLPQSVAPKPDLGEKTRFEFPFNNPKKSVEEAYTEVKTALEQLSDTTLLFLNDLRYIRWNVGDQQGAVLREEHSDGHIEVLKLVDGEEILSSHWLRFSAPVEDLHQFTAPVEGVERQNVAVAFELTFLGNAKTFDTKKPLAKQLKISPAIKGKVSVFFPAEKEVSGLRFHLHAPFIPELSRASIKTTPENMPLYDQLAKVSAQALHSIKAMGLLSGEFLAVLPNNDDPLAERYNVIRKALLHEMKSQALVPTYAGGFAEASRLIQARASMKSLITDEDLAFVTGRKDEPTWAIGATQRNSNQDRLLASLGIPTWDVENLVKLLGTKANEPTYFWPVGQPLPATRQVVFQVLEWLSTKSAEWHQALYALLNRHCEDEGHFGALKEARIVRLVDGSYSPPKKAYFQTGPTNANDALPRVDEKVLIAGTKKAQQAEARKFLVNIGVKEPGELEELTLLLSSRYGPTGDVPSDKVYLGDLKRMISFLERNPQQRGIFAEAFIFRVECPDHEWVKPQAVYLDAPFVCTDLRLFYDSIKHEKRRRWPLSTWYTPRKISFDRLVKFANLVGCASVFGDQLYVETSCEGNPKHSYLIGAPGERCSSPIDRDFALTQNAYDMLSKYQVAASRLVWSAMCHADQKVLRACFQKNKQGGAHWADSQLIWWLRDKIDWVPLKDGSFVKPRNASQSNLHDGFAVDSGYRWLELVEFGTEEKRRLVETTARAAKRAELGFKSEEEYQRALAFSNLPEAAQHRILEEARHKTFETIELPERAVRNAELRAQRVGERAKQTPNRESLIRHRAVQLGYEDAKEAAKLYLRDQYTNSNGQMICQACKCELPFKLPTGDYYFEAVEIVPDAPKRFREGFLALCPNHAAAYQYANAQRNSMHELIVTADRSEIDIALGGVVATLYFTQMHLADVKSCVDSMEDDPV